MVRRDRDAADTAPAESDLAQKIKSELDETAAALRPLQAEREKIEQLFLDGVVTRENAALFNLRLSEATGAIESLVTKREALQRDLGVIRERAKAFMGQTLIDRMAKIARDYGHIPSEAERRAFIRANVVSVDRNEKGTWTIKRHVPCPSSIKQPNWHPLGESNPSFQDENLMS